jgi:hypothetical protein
MKMRPVVILCLLAGSAVLLTGCHTDEITSPISTGPGPTQNYKKVTFCGTYKEDASCTPFGDYANFPTDGVGLNIQLKAVSENTGNIDEMDGLLLVDNTRRGCMVLSDAQTDLLIKDLPVRPFVFRSDFSHCPRAPYDGPCAVSPVNASDISIKADPDGSGNVMISATFDYCNKDADVGTEMKLAIAKYELGRFFGSLGSTRAPVGASQSGTSNKNLGGASVSGSTPGAGTISHGAL